jgi:hypothetical protein
MRLETNEYILLNRSSALLSTASAILKLLQMNPAHGKTGHHDIAVGEPYQNHNQGFIFF